MEPPSKRRFSNILGDVACAASLVGIWPRFIEPNLLATTHLELSLSNLPNALDGLKILQFSDLHLHPNMPDFFIEKLIKKINALQPDIIVFTGDFLCYSTLDDKDRLMYLLSSLPAPHGCFAIFGNHDYAQFVSVNNQGDYDVIESTGGSIIGKGLGRLFKTIVPSGTITPHAKQVGIHQELMKLIRQTPFQLLENTTKTVAIKGAFLNITGLGEHMLGKMDPQKGFKDFQKEYPGIVLVHNPDAVPHLKDYPGEVVLCGHTHGSAINLPWVWKKFVLIENPQLKRGLQRWGDKWVYTNRGIGGSEPFRLFSLPELLVLTLRPKND